MLKPYNVGMLVFVYFLIRLEHIDIPFAVLGIPPKNISSLCPHPTSTHIIACMCVPFFCRIYIFMYKHMYV